LHLNRHRDGPGAGEIIGTVDERVEGQRQAENADQCRRPPQTAAGERPSRRARLDDGPRRVEAREGPRGPLPAAREVAGRRQRGTVCVGGAGDGEARCPAAPGAGHADGARAGRTRRQAAAPPRKRVEGLVLAERAEHVRLIGHVDRRLRDRPRVEHKGDRQGAQVVGRWRRTVVAGREVAVEWLLDNGSAREPFVRAAVTRAGGRVADRTRLNERPAGATLTVGVGSAAQARVRSADTHAGLATAARTVGVRATVSPIARAPAGVVDADAARAGVRCDGPAAAAARAVSTIVGPPRAPHRHEVRVQEDRGGERQIQARHAPGRAIGAPRGVRGERVDHARAGGRPAVRGVGDGQRRPEEAAGVRAVGLSTRRVAAAPAGARPAQSAVRAGVAW